MTIWLAIHTRRGGTLRSRKRGHYRGGRRGESEHRPDRAERGRLSSASRASDGKYVAGTM
jgi:hypothetical protein